MYPIDTFKVVQDLPHVTLWYQKRLNHLPFLFPTVDYNTVFIGQSW